VPNRQEGVVRHEGVPFVNRRAFALMDCSARGECSCRSKALANSKDDVSVRIDTDVKIRTRLRAERGPERGGTFLRENAVPFRDRCGSRKWDAFHDLRFPAQKKFPFTGFLIAMAVKAGVLPFPES